MGLPLQPQLDDTAQGMIGFEITVVQRSPGQGVVAGGAHNRGDMGTVISGAQWCGGVIVIQIRMHVSHGQEP